MATDVDARFSKVVAPGIAAILVPDGAHHSSVAGCKTLCFTNDFKCLQATDQQRTRQAPAALGRVVKTVYILRYIHDEDLRRRIQRQLNRGEARHELARWLFFANQGAFRTGDYEEMMNKASCLSLLSNAVLLWNTVQMNAVVKLLRESGLKIEPTHLSRVSPLAHAHIIPNGTYHFAQARRKLQPDTIAVAD